MIELADIIAPIAAPPAPPPYEWIALGAAVLLLVLFFGLRWWLKRTRPRRWAHAALKRTERALHIGKIDARAAAFDIAHAVSYVQPPPLPFKGRARVGMGIAAERDEPIPHLTSPLKGEEKIARGDPEWAELTQALTHARFSPHPIDAQHAAQLLAQAHKWIVRAPC